MPGGLLGAISGILAGGILGFGAAEWSVLLDTFARSCSFCWWFVFVSLQDPNSVASSAPLLELSGQGPLPCLCCCFLFVLFFGVLVFFVWFLLCCFLVLFSFAPDLTLDRGMVPSPLLTSQCGTLQLHLLNSFISTTMCDDLARATGAGRKKKLLAAFHPSSSLLFHPFNFHHCIATRRRRCLRRSALVRRCAWMAAHCDFRDPGWGDPAFLQGFVAFLTSGRHLVWWFGFFQLAHWWPV